MVSHTLQEYPKELQKKVTLLQHFRSYLEGDSKIKPQNVKNYLEYVLIFIA
jgi:polo-like kinase 1